ncbi:hypothetical protein BESB_074600 [Besnoitia besnoiti]|uniref:Uncharacterized protein n=1 Tax=Besnoitia besnoiti TaxID=94643 RepID=A0A2A9M763_BESBE|nr:uncharacterized protein BESB_074600 [Besnoitia besnoiti]PFH34308.1 hypothetical protein BESB_074600 [Besnoitia besnoiti]
MGTLPGSTLRQHLGAGSWARGSPRSQTADTTLRRAADLHATNVYFPFKWSVAAQASFLHVECLLPCVASSPYPPHLRPLISATVAGRGGSFAARSRKPSATKPPLVRLDENSRPQSEQGRQLAASLSSSAACGTVQPRRELLPSQSQFQGKSRVLNMLSKPPGSSTVPADAQRLRCARLKSAPFCLLEGARQHAQLPGSTLGLHAQASTSIVPPVILPPMSVRSPSRAQAGTASPSLLLTFGLHASFQQTCGTSAWMDELETQKRGPSSLLQSGRIQGETPQACAGSFGAPRPADWTKSVSFRHRDNAGLPSPRRYETNRKSGKDVRAGIKCANIRANNQALRVSLSHASITLVSPFHAASHKRSILAHERAPPRSQSLHWSSGADLLPRPSAASRARLIANLWHGQRPQSPLKCRGNCSRRLSRCREAPGILGGAKVSGSDWTHWQAAQGASNGERGRHRTGEVDDSLNVVRALDGRIQSTYEEKTGVRSRGTSELSSFLADCRRATADGLSRGVPLQGELEDAISEVSTLAQGVQGFAWLRTASRRVLAYGFAVRLGARLLQNQKNEPLLTCAVPFDTSPPLHGSTDSNFQVYEGERLSKTSSSAAPGAYNQARRRPCSLEEAQRGHVQKAPMEERKMMHGVAAAKRAAAGTSEESLMPYPQTLQRPGAAYLPRPVTGGLRRGSNHVGTPSAACAGAAVLVLLLGRQGQSRLLRGERRTHMRHAKVEGTETDTGDTYRQSSGCGTRSKSCPAKEMSAEKEESFSEPMSDGTQKDGEDTISVADEAPERHCDAPEDGRTTVRIGSMWRSPAPREATQADARTSGMFYDAKRAAQLGSEARGAGVPRDRARSPARLKERQQEVAFGVEIDVDPVVVSISGDDLAHLRALSVVFLAFLEHVTTPGPAAEGGSDSFEPCETASTSSKRWSLLSPLLSPCPTRRERPADHPRSSGSLSASPADSCERLQRCTERSGRRAVVSDSEAYCGERYLFRRKNPISAFFRPSSTPSSPANRRGSRQQQDLVLMPSDSSPFHAASARGNATRQAARALLHSALTLGDRVMRSALTYDAQHAGPLPSREAPHGRETVSKQELVSTGVGRLANRTSSVDKLANLQDTRAGRSHTPAGDPPGDSCPDQGQTGSPSKNAAGTSGRATGLSDETHRVDGPDGSASSPDACTCGRGRHARESKKLTGLGSDLSHSFRSAAPHSACAHSETLPSVRLQLDSAKGPSRTSREHEGEGCRQGGHRRCANPRASSSDVPRAKTIDLRQRDAGRRPLESVEADSCEPTRDGARAETGTSQRAGERVGRGRCDSYSRDVRECKEAGQLYIDADVEMRGVMSDTVSQRTEQLDRIRESTRGGMSWTVPRSQKEMHRPNSRLWLCEQKSFESPSFTPGSFPPLGLSLAASLGTIQRETRGLDQEWSTGPYIATGNWITRPASPSAPSVERNRSADGALRRSAQRNGDAKRKQRWDRVVPKPFVELPVEASIPAAGPGRAPRQEFITREQAKDSDQKEDPSADSSDLSDASKSEDWDAHSQRQLTPPYDPSREGRRTTTPHERVSHAGLRPAQGTWPRASAESQAAAAQGCHRIDAPLRGRLKRLRWTPGLLSSLKWRRGTHGRLADAAGAGQHEKTTGRERGMKGRRQSLRSGSSTGSSLSFSLYESRPASFATAQRTKRNPFLSLSLNTSSLRRPQLRKAARGQDGKKRLDDAGAGVQASPAVSGVVQAASRSGRCRPRPTPFGALARRLRTQAINVSAAVNTHETPDGAGGSPSSPDCPVPSSGDPQHECTLAAEASKSFTDEQEPARDPRKEGRRRRKMENAKDAGEQRQTESSVAEECQRDGSSYACAFEETSDESLKMGTQTETIRPYITGRLTLVVSIDVVHRPTMTEESVVEPWAWDVAFTHRPPLTHLQPALPSFRHPLGDFPAASARGYTHLVSSHASLPSSSSRLMSGHTQAASPHRMPLAHVAASHTTVDRNPLLRPDAWAGRGSRVASSTDKVLSPSFVCESRQKLAQRSEADASISARLVEKQGAPQSSAGSRRVEHDAAITKGDGRWSSSIVGSALHRVGEGQACRARFPSDPRNHTGEVPLSGRRDSRNVDKFGWHLAAFQGKRKPPNGSSRTADEAGAHEDEANAEEGKAKTVQIDKRPTFLSVPSRAPRLVMETMGRRPTPPKSSAAGQRRAQRDGDSKEDSADAEVRFLTRFSWLNVTVAPLVMDAFVETADAVDDGRKRLKSALCRRYHSCVVSPNAHDGDNSGVQMEGEAKHRCTRLISSAPSSKPCALSLMAAAVDSASIPLHASRGCTPFIVRKVLLQAFFRSLGGAAARPSLLSSAGIDVQDGRLRSWRDPLLQSMEGERGREAVGPRIGGWHAANKDGHVREHAESCEEKNIRALGRLAQDPSGNLKIGESDIRPDIEEIQQTHTPPELYRQADAPRDSPPRQMLSSAARILRRSMTPSQGCGT